MLAQVLIQSLAIVALIFWLISYQLRERKSILAFQLVSSGFFIVHYYLLDAKTGVLVTILTALRLSFFYFKKKNSWTSHPIMLWLFIVLTLAVTLLTLSSFWVLFAFLGASFAILACWQYEPKMIRKLFIPSHICWITYDIIVGSYGGALSEFMLGASTIVSLFRKNLDKTS